MNSWTQLPNQWNELDVADGFNTVLRHFAGPRKPLCSYSTSKNRNLFFLYLKDTPFYNYWITWTRTRLFSRKISILLHRIFKIKKNSLA
jgi:hypothetical protein